MIYRNLGNTELITAPIVVGGNVFGWTLDGKKSIAILDEAFDLGFRTIDTANSYSYWAEGNVGGESETIIGKWLKKWGDRDKVVLITKVGSAVGKGVVDISEKQILREAENSLRRLQTDYIDLYLTHRDDERMPVEETLAAYQKLIAAGKVRYIGASNISPSRLEESLNAAKKAALPKYQVLQPEYSLAERRYFEQELAPLCERESLGVITYYPLASGFLSGKYRSEADLGKSARGPAVKKYLNEGGERILEAMEEVAGKHKVSLAAVALAWQIHKPVITAPVASVTSSSQMKAFTEAAGLSLSPDDMEKLDVASAW